MDFLKILGVVVLGLVGYKVATDDGGATPGGGHTKATNVLSGVQSAHHHVVDALETHEDALRDGTLTEGQARHLLQMLDKAREATPGTYGLKADPYVKAALSKINDAYNDVIPALVHSYEEEEPEERSPPLSASKQRTMLKRLERLEEELRSLRVALHDE